MIQKTAKQHDTGASASCKSAAGASGLRWAKFLHWLKWRQDRRLRRFDWLLPWAEPASLELLDDSETSTRGAWAFFRWPLTARILSINLLVLIIPLYGFIRADTYRSSLIEAELSSMQAEGLIVSRALGATAERVPIDFNSFLDGSVVEGVDTKRSATVPVLGTGSRSTLQLLTNDLDSRMRLFDLSGDLAADTRYMGSGRSPVRVEPLDLEDANARRGFSIVDLMDRLLGAQPLFAYREPTIDRASQHSVTNLAYDGESASEVRIGNDGRLVFLVALPVQEYRKVIGALLVSRDETGVEAAVQRLRSEVWRATFVTLGVTVLLSMLLASTIARPIRRLAINAVGVARSKRRQVQIPDMRFRRDEIGDLSFATRRMTEVLWDRLDATDAFAADVSHELKNPLTSLKSAVETMQAYPNSPRRGELLDIINHDVSRMDRLITDISRSSRVDAEISRSEWDVIDLVQLVEGLICARSPMDKREASVEFVVDVAEQANAGPLMVRGVGDRLAQVLNNLHDNAETFSPAGGKVLTKIQRIGTKIRVSVLDQGPGIPADRLGRVFERFYTDRPESDGFGNHSGLGLSIVKQIIEGHSGRIWAENADDEADEAQGFTGAKFVFELKAED